MSDSHENWYYRLPEDFKIPARRKDNYSNFNDTKRDKIMRHINTYQLKQIKQKVNQIYMLERPWTYY